MDIAELATAHLRDIERNTAYWQREVAHATKAMQSEIDALRHDLERARAANKSLRADFDAAIAIVGNVREAVYHVG